jgi:hypothetical protein
MLRHEFGWLSEELREHEKFLQLQPGLH